MVQFEVVNKEDTAQSRAGPSQPGHGTASRGVPWAPRPPRPAVRLSTHPYQPARQVKKLAQDAALPNADSSGASAAPGHSHGYQQLALLPIPEPEQAAPAPTDPAVSPSTAPALPRVDWGHLSEPTGRPSLRPARHVAVQAQQQRQVALSPSRAPLEQFAEQLQADLGGTLGRPPSPFHPTQQSTPLPHPQSHQAESPQQPAAAAEAARAAAPAPAAGPRPRQPHALFPPAAGISSSGVPEPPREAASRPEGPSQIRQVLQGGTPGPPPPRPPPAAEPLSRGIVLL